MTPTRSLPSLANLRDVGGHRTANGHRVRCGLVFRSEAPALADPRDALALHQELGITEVIDLRRPTEAANRPLPADLVGAVHGHPVPFDVDVPPHLRRDDRADAPLTGADMGRFYAWMAERNIEPLREVYRRISAARAPILVHCAVGKDRTGVTVALALLGLGVAVDDVVADYHRSHAAMRVTLPRLDPLLGSSAGDGDARLGAPVATMTTFLGELGNRYGSPHGFWDRLDHDGSLLGRLRDRLLETP